MTEHITTILDLLASSDIDHDPATLERHHSQGIMSSVYSISSTLGTLIIHYASYSPTQAHFKPWEKLKPVSGFLRAIPTVPAAEVLLTLKLPHHYVVVQKMLPGRSAGVIELQGDTITTRWHDPAERYEQQIEDIVAAIHAAPLKGFGNIIAVGGTIRGEYDSWEEFLTKEIPFYIDGIAHADAEQRTPPDSAAEDAARFFEKVLPFIVPLKRASLVSCDIMNPSNVLVDEGRITGIVDWEWALAADPAWEFCYLNPFSLTRYFSHFPELRSSEDARRTFRMRTDIYEYLLYIMWSYGTSGSPEVYTACRARMKRKLAEAPRLFATLGID